MASISHLQLSLLLLLPSLMFTITLASSTWSSAKEINYNKWISWNIKNYQQKATLKGTESIVLEARGRGAARKVGLPDAKLSKAEMNKVSLSVSQNGSGDFKTIGDALNSIPLPNTRRVILLIKPGVYRYICLLLPEPWLILCFKNLNI